MSKLHNFYLACQCMTCLPVCTHTAAAPPQQCVPAPTHLQLPAHRSRPDRGARDTTEDDKLAVLAAAARLPPPVGILGAAMVTTMAQTGDRVDDLARTDYHLMAVNCKIKTDSAYVPLFSFRTNASKTCKGETSTAGISSQQQQ
jgi:hypothetical protein